MIRAEICVVKCIIAVTSYANLLGEAVYSEVKQRRVGKVLANAHLISGTWQQVSLKIDERANDWILDLDGDRFSSWSPQGVGYQATIDGPPVPIKGDEAGATASVTKPRPDTIIEKDAINGVVGGILTFTVLPGGQTMKASTLAPKTGETGTFYLRKVK